MARQKKEEEVGELEDEETAARQKNKEKNQEAEEEAVARQK